MIGSLIEARQAGILTSDRFKVMTQPALLGAHDHRWYLRLTQAFGAVLFFQLINARQGLVDEADCAASRTRASWTTRDVLGVERRGVRR